MKYSVSQYSNDKTLQQKRPPLKYLSQGDLSDKIEMQRIEKKIYKSSVAAYQVTNLDNLL